MQSRHSKLYCLCSRDIQNFIVCAFATFKTLLFVQSRHSKLYCLCNRDIQNFIVCAIATFKTLLFVQSSHSKLFSLRVPSGAPYSVDLPSLQINSYTFMEYSYRLWHSKVADVAKWTEQTNVREIENINENVLSLFVIN